jgi:hypothetical protein
MSRLKRQMIEKKAAKDGAPGRMPLKQIEARLRREPNLDKLDAKVVEALARMVMRFLDGSANLADYTFWYFRRAIDGSADQIRGDADKEPNLA